jgi:hypothetical protein
MAGCGEEFTQMLQPAKFGKARSAVAVLGLADERDRGTRSPRPGAAGERQNVDLVAGLMLAAGC